MSGDVDLTTAQGRLVARLKGAVAAHEIEHKKARQLRAARQKAERGEPNWSRAFGYHADTHQPDPHTAPLVKQAYAAILAGASLGDVCRQWNAAGAFTRHRQAVDRRDADQVPAQAPQRGPSRLQGGDRRQGHLAGAGRRGHLAGRANRAGRHPSASRAARVCAAIC